MVRFLYCSLGLSFVTLGFIGAFLPLLPTTPFLILALMCFARGSKQLHNWLLEHRLLGKYLRDWENHRVIPINAKLTATGMILSSSVMMALTSTVPAIMLAGIVASMLLVLLYIWSFPSSVKSSQPTSVTTSVATR